MKGKTSLNFIILLILCLLSYFYFDYRKVGILEKSIVTGVFIGASSYVLYAMKAGNWLKGVILLILAGLVFFFLLVLDGNIKEGKNIDLRFTGNWVTDTTDGYAINFRVVDDSVNLSRSDAPLSKAYKLTIVNDTIILTSPEVINIYKWNYKFLDDNGLQLYNDQDTLTLKSVK